MEHLKLEHLAPYLPYGLKINTIENELYLLDLDKNKAQSKYKGHLINIYEWDEIKPILRPLSDIKIDQLRYIYFQVIATDSDMYGNCEEFIDYFNETSIEHLSYCIYSQLLEWHFDVFGLIPKGLAIDINTLKR